MNNQLDLKGTNYSPLCNFTVLCLKRQEEKL